MWINIPFVFNFIVFQLSNAIDTLIILYGLPLKEHKHHVFLKMFLGMFVLSCPKYFGNYLNGINNYICTIVFIVYFLVMTKIYCVATVVQTCMTVFIMEIMTTFASLGSTVIYMQLVPGVNLQTYDYHSWDVFYCMFLIMILLLLEFFLYCWITGKNGFLTYQISFLVPVFFLFMIMIEETVCLQFMMWSGSEETYQYVSIAFMGYAISSIVIILVMSRFNYNTRVEAELLKLEAERKQLQSDYELMEERIEQRARIRHDYNNQIQVAKGILNMDKETGMRLLRDMQNHITNN